MARRFEMNEGGSAKFWEISVAGTEVTVRFGKIGTAGQTKTKAHASEDEARREADGLAREKTKKGYAEVGGEPAAAQPNQAGAPSAKDEKRVATEETPELALFRATRKGFFASPDFGEVRFLAAGEVPRMRALQPDAPVWGHADWVATEADGACIGYLVVDGLPLAERPVVHLDNEGTLTISGASLVDHFGSQTTAAFAGDDDLEPLRKFCEKNSLSKWRSADTMKAIRTALGVAHLDASQPVTLDVVAWKAEVAKTQPGAPTKPVKAKVPSTKKGATTRPLYEIQPFAGYDADGAPTFGVPGDKASQLHRWNGERFEIVATAPGYATRWGYHGTTRFVARVTGGALGVSRDGGPWEDFEFTLEKADHLSFHSHPRGPLYAIGESQRVLRFDGTKFAPIEELPFRRAVMLVSGPDGTLYVVGGMTPEYAVVRETFAVSPDGSLTRLPDVPNDTDFGNLKSAVIVGTTLALLGDHGLHRFDLTTRTWAEIIPLAYTKWLAPLDAKTVAVLRPHDAKVYAVDLETGALSEKGTLQIRPNDSSQVLGAHGTSPSGEAETQILVVGGSLGTTRTAKPYTEPQIWSASTGTSRGVPGCEDDVIRQGAEQLAKSFKHPFGRIVPLPPE